MSLECQKCGAPMQFQSARFPAAGLWCPTCEAPCEMCGKPGAGPCLIDDEDGRDQSLPFKILCGSCCKGARSGVVKNVLDVLEHATYRQPPRSEVDLLREAIVEAQACLVERVDRLTIILAITGGAAATTWVLLLLHVWSVL